MLESKLRQLLQKGLNKMGLSLHQEQQEKLIAYVLLLDKWNKAYNLSAVRDPVQMVSRHILDSLSLVDRLTAIGLSEGRPLKILDVGTGPGLPGIPLAIYFPASQFFLLDSNGKKTRFVFQSAITLGIGNISVENTRIESYQCPEQLDIVVSRAFASLLDFTTGCEHLCSARTRLLAMKGIYPQEEIAQLPASWSVVHEQAVEVPGCEGERHLLELIKTE